MRLKLRFATRKKFFRKSRQNQFTVVQSISADVSGFCLWDLCKQARNIEGTERDRFLVSVTLFYSFGKSKRIFNAVAGVKI